MTSNNWTRRGLLLFPAAVAAARAENRVVPPERVRFPDPSTEFEVFRVTDPGHSCFLPPARNRIFNRRGSFLLYSGDRGGSLQAYALDLKSWQSRQITEAGKLDPQSLHLTPDDRNLVYGDGEKIMVAPLSGGRGREVAEAGGDGVSVTADGPSVLVAESGTRLVMAPLLRGAARTIAENPEGLKWPMARPKRASAAYHSKDSIWVAHFDGQRNYRLKTAPGGIGGATWSPDGRTLLYLSFPEDKAKSYQIRENNPDTGEDKLIASTTQFVAFAPNSDASVFVGASASKAGPHILLMLRVVRRELVLCEHKTMDPVSASPVFSPDSQKIFFQSDRHGKPAIYTMVVDKLVEKTEEEAEEEQKRETGGKR